MISKTHPIIKNDTQVSNIIYSSNYGVIKRITKRKFVNQTKGTAKHLAILRCICHEVHQEIIASRSACR